jgi:hypothetical protein
MRIHGIIAARPAEMFAAHEAAGRLPLSLPYDVPVFTRVKMHRDFHVEVARSLYSAPQVYLGCHLDTRADSALVKLFHRGVLVKTHPRQQPGRRVTDSADLPAEKTAYAMRDVASLAAAARRGPPLWGQCRGLCRPAAGHRPTLDEHAPATGLGSRCHHPVHPRPGRIPAREDAQHDPLLQGSLSAARL